MERFTFFWRGPFSQWYPSTFKDEGYRGSTGITFCCAEQYMMHGKAVLFGDEPRARAILETTDPKKQKAIGRVVEGFDVATWEREARRIVYWGNYLKYTQNQELQKALLDTDGTTLVEASPYDRIWGIGLEATDPRAQRRETWLGRNWLGDVLTAVRDDIIKGRRLDEIFGPNP